MAWIVAGRVRDSSTSSGTGTLTVTGTAPVGYRTFSAVCVIGDQFPYFIQSRSANEWEYGIASYVGTNQISRDIIKGSSNAGAAVNFTASNTIDIVLDTSEFFANVPVASPDCGFAAWAAQGGF